MSSPLTDILNDITHKKDNLLRVSSENYRKEFAPFVINRFLKSDIDCLFEAQCMNESSHLDKDIQYDFLIHTIPKKKRFLKYVKAPKPDNEIKAIMKYYTYSRQKAEEVYDLLTDSQINEIIKRVNPPKK